MSWYYLKTGLYRIQIVICILLDILAIALDLPNFIELLVSFIPVISQYFVGSHGYNVTGQLQIFLVHAL